VGQRFYHSVLAAFCLIALGCNEPLNPAGPLDQHMFVFSIFSTDRDVQFVRVAAPYMPSDFDPAGDNSDNSVTDATVTLGTEYEKSFNPATPWMYLWERKTFQLRDTVVSSSDTNGQAFLLHVYTLNPFTPEHGKTYTLVVTSASHGGTTAQIVMPGEPVLSKPWATNEILNDALYHKPDEVIRYDVELAPTAAAYVYHLFLCYDVLKGSAWVHERYELPITSEDPSSYSLEYPRYPELTEATSLKKISVTYKAGYLQNIIKELTKVRYVDTRLTYTYVVFQLLQTEPNLYSYYKNVREYQDPRSIRLDEPPFPRLAYGAYGMVGAYTLDSLVIELPSNFNGNR
jgi:hypothetical protein